jgi:hypothetical protein
MKTVVAALAVLSVAATRAGAEPAEPFAVVELFTSEGCSSCPPADRLLAEIAQQTVSDGQHVFVLAFHVDYWDRLGWTDRFARPAFTSRQRGYAAALDAGTVYTPEMVVNGRVAFAGSDAHRARQAIAQALAEHPQGSLATTARWYAAVHAVTVRLQPSGLPNGTALSVVVVEDGLSSQVARGENAGRLLTHTHVVRAFRTIALARSTEETTLQLPPTLDPRRSSVIAFAQDPDTMRILAAAAAPIR